MPKYDFTQNNKISDMANPLIMGFKELNNKSIPAKGIPFAREGSGGLWVVLNDELIGYIGTEGECGIVARNIQEFMNIVSVWGGYLDDYWDEEVLENSESFYETMNDSDRLEDYDDIKKDRRIFKKFIKEIKITAIVG